MDQEEKLAQERKEKLKNFFKKNNFVKIFLGFAIISFIFGLIGGSLYSYSDFFSRNIIRIVPNFGAVNWYLLGIAFLIAMVIAYYEKIKLAFLPILTWILWINVYIRSLPMKINPGTGKPWLWDISTNGWTLGPDLDPFLFLRYAKDIVKNGSLMAVDYMRYVPIGFETGYETTLLPYIIAYLYKFISFFKEISVDYAGVVLPVIASVFTAIFFFLLVRKIFEEKGNKESGIIALISTTLMVFLPSLLTRTIAGIPEKESLGFCLMFLAFYLFLSAWRTKKILNSGLLGIGAGISTALMGLIWGGVEFIYVAIGISGFIALILGKVEKKELLAYALWLWTSLFLWAPLTLRATLKGLLASSRTGFAVVIFGFMLINFILFKTKIKNLKIFHHPTIKKIPQPIIAIIVTLLLGIIVVPFILGFSSLLATVENTFALLVRPYTDRLSFTVAENKQPFFNEWLGSMGVEFFWLFFIGSIILFNEMIKKLKFKEKLILTSSYVFFLFALIFSRTSSSSTLNGTNTLSLIVYFSGYLVLAIAAAYILFIRYRQGEMEILKDIELGYLFIFGLSFIAIVGARSAVRLIMLLTPIASILIGYLVVKSVSSIWKSKDIGRLLWITFSIIVVLLLLNTYASYFNTSVNTANGHVPSLYTQQWQKAMGWVRENTPEDSVFGHWWDYGYWVQSMGERATMLDGGNSYSYWNYLMGRHGLTAETQTEALELLYSHDVDYFLIDSTEIGKYTAYSSIGSDENYDRYSWIETLSKDSSKTQETKESIKYLYAGGILSDEDIVIKDESNKEILLPRQAAGIGAVIVEQNKETGEYVQPVVYMVYNNQQVIIPMRYLYINNELIDFGLDQKNTIEACAYVFTKLDNGQIDETGVLMYLSSRNMRALWVRLYIIGEENNFKLVHEEPSYLSIAIKEQTGKDYDFVFYQGIQGPIKIWKINYKGNEKINEEYLMPNFPEYIGNRRFK